MAEETVDALVLQARFDESGLDVTAQAMLQAARVVARTLSGIAATLPDFDINVDPATQALGTLKDTLREVAGGMADEIQLIEAQINSLAGTNVGQAGERIAAGFQEASAQSERFSRDIRDQIAGNEAWVRGLAAAEAQLRTTAAAVAALPTTAQRMAAAFRESGAQATTLSREVREVIAGNEAMARGVAAASEQFRLQAVAMQNVATANQRLLASFGQAGSQAAGLSREIRDQVAGNAAWARGLANTTELLRQQAQAAAQAQTATQRLNQAFAQAGQQANVLSRATRDQIAGQEAWARGMAAMRAQQQGLDTSLASSLRGTGRLSGGLIALTTSLTGVPPAIASVVSGLLLLSAGSGVVLGIAAGVAVIAAAYELFTRKAREAREATEEFVQQQVSAARARDPFAQLIRNLDGVEGEVEGVTQATIRLNRELENLQRLSRAQGQGGFQLFQRDIDETRAQLRNIETALEESARTFAERVFAEVDRANQARLSAERSAIQDALAAEQQGFQLREVQLRAAFQAEEITRQQFTDRRIQLAREAAQAEIAAIRREQESVRSVTPRTEDEQTAQRNKLEAMDRAIQLRRGELAIQEQQITAEQQLADALDARREPIDQIAQALERVRVALENLPVDRFRSLIEGQRGAQAAGLNLLPAPEAEGIAGGFERTAQAAGEIGEALADAAAESNKFFRRAQREVEDTRTEMEKLDDAIRDVTSGLESVVDAAVNIGLIGEEAADAIGRVQDLADAIGAVMRAASAGNILGLVGAGLNILAGAFGEGELERAMRENTEAIRRNTAAQEGRFEGAGGQAEVLAGFRAALAAIAQQGISNFPLFAAQHPVGATTRLNEALLPLGLTVEDVERVMQQLIPGFELVDEKGRLIPGAFDDIVAAAEEVVKASLRLAGSFSEQEENELRQARLRGETIDAEERFRAQLEAARRVGATAIEQAFAGVDLLDPEAVRAAAQKLLDDLNAGLIDPKQLGGLTREDVEGIIDGAIDHIDALGEASRKATLEMSNIPRGFRQAALAFQSQIPGLGPTSPPTGLEPIFEPRPIGGDGASLPVLLDKLVEKINKAPPVQQRIEINGIRMTVEELYEALTRIADRRGGAGSPDSFTSRPPGL